MLPVLIMRIAAGAAPRCGSGCTNVIVAPSVCDAVTLVGPIV
jgi:hypothetical protein